METIDETCFYIFAGITAFNFCLSLAILLFVFYLWIDIYHRKWIEKLDLLDKQIKKM